MKDYYLQLKGQISKKIKFKMGTYNVKSEKNRN